MQESQTDSFSVDTMSQQKRTAWKKRLSVLSTAQLIEVQVMAQVMLDNNTFDDELEIASRHYNPALVHSTHRDEGRRKLQMVYCCKDHCSKCPHGSFWFVYNWSASSGKTKVRFVGRPALPSDVIDKMRARLTFPMQSYELVLGPPTPKSNGH